MYCSKWLSPNTKWVRHHRTMVSVIVPRRVVKQYFAIFVTKPLMSISRRKFTNIVFFSFPSDLLYL